MCVYRPPWWDEVVVPTYLPLNGCKPMEDLKWAEVDDSYDLDVDIRRIASGRKNDGNAS